MLWTLIICCGLLTFLTRFLPLAGGLPTKLPSVVERGMRYVPIAVLTPIIIHSVFLPTGEIVILENTLIPSALLALLTAVATGRVMVTIAVGMASLCALEYLIIF